MRISILVGSVITLCAVGSAGAAAQGIPRTEIVVDDAFILGTRVNVDQAEIETAQWAAKHASSKQVREFAQSLLRGHSNAQNAAQVLAANLRIELKILGDTSKALNWRTDAAKSEMRRLKGAKFDRAFLTAIRDEHASEIEKVNGWYASAATSDSVKAYLQAITPTLVKHQQTAARLLSSSGKTVAVR